MVSEYLVPSAGMSTCRRAPGRSRRLRRGRARMRRAALLSWLSSSRWNSGQAGCPGDERENLASASAFVARRPAETRGVEVAKQRWRLSRGAGLVSLDICERLPC